MVERDPPYGPDDGPSAEGDVWSPFERAGRSPTLPGCLDFLPFNAVYIRQDVADGVRDAARELLEEAGPEGLLEAVHDLAEARRDVEHRLTALQQRELEIRWQGLRVTTTPSAPGPPPSATA